MHFIFDEFAIENPDPKELEFILTTLQMGIHPVLRIGLSKVGEATKIFNLQATYIAIYKATSEFYVFQTYAPAEFYLANPLKEFASKEFVSLLNGFRDNSSNDRFVIPEKYTLTWDDTEQLILDLYKDEELSKNAANFYWEQLPKNVQELGFDEQTQIDKKLLVAEKALVYPAYMWRFKDKSHDDFEFIWSPNTKIIATWMDEMDDHHSLIVCKTTIQKHPFLIQCLTDGTNIYLELQRIIPSIVDLYYNYEMLRSLPAIDLINPNYLGSNDDLTDFMDNLPSTDEIIEDYNGKFYGATILAKKSVRPIPTSTALTVKKSLAKEVVIDFMIHQRLRTDLRWFSWSGDETDVKSILEL